MENANIEIKFVSELLAEVAIILIMNGANTSRTKKNAQRIAEAWGYEANYFLSLSAAIVSVRDKSTNEMHTIVRSIPHIGINYNIVSEISILSWEIVQKKMSFNEVNERLNKILTLKPYPKPFLWFFVGLAGASLCRMLGGSYIEFSITFLATVCGLIIRQLMTEKGYNVFIIFAISAFTAVSVVNIFRMFISLPLNSAFASSVLFLIPGVPLINSFIDILEGHISQGIARGVQATSLIFMIALGLFLSLFLFGLWN